MKLLGASLIKNVRLGFGGQVGLDTKSQYLLKRKIFE